MLFRATDVSSSDDERQQERARARSRRRDPRARARFRAPATAKLRRTRRGPGCGPRALVSAALLCLLCYELLVAHFPALAHRAHRAHIRNTQRATPAGSPVPHTPRAVSGATAAAAAQAKSEARAHEARARAIQEAAAARDRAATAAVAAKAKQRLNVAARGTPSGDVVNGLDVRPPAPGRSAAGALASRWSDPGSGENFWDWFQATRSGIPIVCPLAQRRLCQMTYKFVRKYKIRAMYDASCSRNTAWMRVMLRQLSREVWGFRYVCAESSAIRMRRAKRALATLPFVSFSQARWWRTGFPTGVDLVFAWDVLAHTAYGRVWTFFVRVRRDGVKYVLVDNYPGILNDPVRFLHLFHLRALVFLT